MKRDHSFWGILLLLLGFPLAILIHAAAFTEATVDSEYNDLYILYKEWIDA